jgi:hypothetical protein
MKSLLLIFLSLFSVLSQASAGINAMIAEVGSNVVASWSGDIDVSSLSPTAYPFNDGPYVIPTTSAIENADNTAVYYSDVFDTVITDFGTGGFSAADSTTGALFAAQFDTDQNRIILPSGFSSGSVEGSITFNNATLASLGITENFTFSSILNLGEGKTDTFNFGTSAVPEPSIYAVFSGLTALFFAATRRRR